MKLKNTILILLAAALLAAAVFTIVSADTDSILSFFGFGKATQTPTPTATTVYTEAKTQSTPKPESDPFGTGSAGLSSLDWDDDPFAGYDPALVELDEPEVASKSSGSSIYDDPFANSFSPDKYNAEVPSDFSSSENQTVSKVNLDPPPGQTNTRPISRITPSPTPMILYRFDRNPVFRPMCELPRTGFPTGKFTEIKESVTYTKTNMSLSIPVLSVNEDIVIVPLVDDNFPVESLGSSIGLLEGSGPTEEDLFVLVGHNHLNTQDQGPFSALSALKESDLIFVNGANNAKRTFVVYANEKFASDDIDGLLTYARPGCMILITCEDESVDGGYLNRRVIFAEAKED